jgi:protein-disulfide isomerase
MSRQDTLLNAALIISAASALISTAFVVSKTIRGDPPRLPAAETVQLAEDEWRGLTNVGQRIGPPTAPVTILEFSDFQCPFCRDAAASFTAMRRKYGDQVSIVFRHFPLERKHIAARSSAIASNCAAAQGRFEAFHDALFADQDSIGKKPMGWFAARARVPDERSFLACLGKPGAAAHMVDRDMAAGDKFGVAGTPTVVINGIRIVGGAPLPLIDSLIKNALGGSK